MYLIQRAKKTQFDFLRQGIRSIIFTRIIQKQDRNNNNILS
jgi:hypothetical protein